MNLSSGIVWWNTVSNTTTFGFPGIDSIAALIPVTAALLWTGANAAHSSIFLITSSSTITDDLNLSAPCTTLCPIPSISVKLFIVLYFGSNNSCVIKSIASLWFFTGWSNLIFSPLTLWVTNDFSPILSYVPFAITSSLSMFINWYFKDELPQFNTKIFILYFLSLSYLFY